MTYLKVRWHHSFSDEPVLLHCELDANLLELRKVEVYADGRIGYAGDDEEFGGTRLGWEATPPSEEIAADPQFEPQETNKQEFEEVWECRKKWLGNS